MKLLINLKYLPITILTILKIVMNTFTIIFIIIKTIFIQFVLKLQKREESEVYDYNSVLNDIKNNIMAYQ